MVKTRVWECVGVKQQGCNALCVTKTLDVADIEYLGGAAGQVTHQIRWCDIAVSPLKQCLFFFFLSFSIFLSYFVLFLPMVAFSCFLAIIPVGVFSLQHAGGRISTLMARRCPPSGEHRGALGFCCMKLYTPRNCPEK